MALSNVVALRQRKLQNTQGVTPGPAPVVKDKPANPIPGAPGDGRVSAPGPMNNAFDSPLEQQIDVSQMNQAPDYYNPGDMTTNGDGTPPAPAQAQATPDQQNNSAPGGFDRTAFRDASMSRPVGQTAADFIASHPEISAGVQFVPGSKDKVILPTGEVLDLSINADAQGSGTANGWTGAGQWVNGQIQQYAPDGGSGGGGYSAPGPMNNSTGALSNPGGRADTLFDILMRRAQQSENIDRNDPYVRAQSDAFNAQGQQARRDYLSAQAEQGGAYGNLTSERRRSAEELGKSTGAFEAQAMLQQQQIRKSEIENALNGGLGYLTSQQQMALQEELTRLQLAQQESQFGRNLGQHAYEYDTTRWDNIFD